MLWANRTARAPRGSFRCRRASASRSGLTLIELLAALVASTMLLAAMAGTVVIAVKQIELPLVAPDDAVTRQVTELIRADLRYASSVREPERGTVVLTRTGFSGQDEAVRYSIGPSGLLRSIDAGPHVPILANTDELDWIPHWTSSGRSSTAPPQVRSSTNAVTTSNTREFTLAVPPGLVSGDLLLVAYGSRGGQSVSLSPMTWTRRTTHRNGSLASEVWTAEVTHSTPATITLRANRRCNQAAIAVGIAEANLGNPVTGFASDSGFTLGLIRSNLPRPVTIPTLTDGHLNLQVFVGTGAPWSDDGLRLASFNDVSVGTASQFGFARLSLGVAWRYGPPPTLNQAPRVPSSLTSWQASSLQIEAAP